MKPGEDLAIDDVILVIEDDLPPTKWQMVRIMQLHKGKDGHVRAFTIQLKSDPERTNQKDGRNAAIRTLERPINKICKLPVSAPGPPEDVLNAEQQIL